MKVINLVVTVLLCGWMSIADAGVFSSEPPKDYMDLQVAVKGHTGTVSGFGYSLGEFDSALKKTDAQLSWNKESEDQWVLHVLLRDKAARRTNKLTFGFTKLEEKAAVTRYIDNGNEISPYQLSVAVTPILSSFGQMLGKTKTDGALGNAAAKTTGNGIMKGVPGNYRCDSGESVVIAATQKDQVKLSLTNTCEDNSASFTDLVSKLACHAKECEAKFKSGRCQLFLISDKDGISITSNDPNQGTEFPCCRDEHRIISVNCKKVSPDAAK